jgi:hypothetical protein
MFIGINGLIHTHLRNEPLANTEVCLYTNYLKSCVFFFFHPEDLLLAKCQDPALSGVSIAPTSEVGAADMLMLLILGN